jgi:SAM-dependent methyltransferase
MASTQRNSYDSKAVEWASRIRAGQNRLQRYIEKPAMADLLPDLTDGSVLCLGCGSAEEAELLQARGARQIFGIDGSAELIAIARRFYPDCQFEVMNLDDLELPEAAYDLAYASMALHYARDWSAMLQRVYRAISPGGSLQFSVPHPAKYAGIVGDNGGNQSALLGYKRDGEVINVYGDYLNPHPLADRLPGANLQVHYQYRPIAHMVRPAIRAGFVLESLAEPAPIAECRQADPAYWQIYSRIPQVLVCRFRKPSESGSG